MSTMTTEIDTLYKVRRGRVDIVDVPELAYLIVEGNGDPNGAEFREAVQALYAVSYGAHFAVKKERGEAPRVMPLEGLWWADDPRQQDIITAIALGWATPDDTDRAAWRWRAMIAQLPPIDEEVIAQASGQARAKAVPALDRLHFQRWREGLCAQTLHVGPYAAEAPTIVRLHEALTAAGYRPRGRHHEIYLGDPRRSAPDKLRTLLRHPIEPADAQPEARPDAQPGARPGARLGEAAGQTPAGQAG